MKKGIVILLVCMLLLSACSADNSSGRWAYAMDNILCIGDSLTEGAYIPEPVNMESINENYPYYLSRMLNTEVTNAGVGGYSASDWYIKLIDNYDYTKYNTVIIWLGTNNGLTDTLDTDVEPFTSADDFLATETGYYCKIIERIKNENPDCLILLINVFATKGDLKTTNTAIAHIAARYDLHVIDSSCLSMKRTTELHAGLENPHFGKAGNIAAAELIIRDVGKWIAERPIRSEFGLSIKQS